MNSKKLIVAALLLSGLAINAKDNLLFTKGNNDNGSIFSHRKSTPRHILHSKSSSAREWDEVEVNGGGLFINFGIHFPSSKFLNSDDVKPSTPNYLVVVQPKYKLGFDFELGNYFRFAKLEDGKMGIGLRATWLSLSYASATRGNDIYRALQISAIRLGPQFGFAINEYMGVDAFYQIGYNFTDMFGAIDDPIEQKDKGLNLIYTGLSHEFGAAFHFRVFSVGFGYRFGKLTNISNVYDGKTEDELSGKFPVNNFRITLGFKF